MGFAITHSRTVLGVDAPLVRVETHLSPGLPKFLMVGLPESIAKESKERVRSAIINSHFEFPNRRITVNLAPTDLPKTSGKYDLAIALGILAASHQIPEIDFSDYEFAAELSLSGDLRPTSQILPFTIATQKANKKLIICAENITDAALVSNVEVFLAKNLTEVISHFVTDTPLTKLSRKKILTAIAEGPDLKDVIGQHQAKRVLEIAAAGQHSLLFIGPPGTGKTLLASCIPGILPPLTEKEMLDLATLHSLTNPKNLLPHKWCRPFRSPHHTSSAPALVGGGNPPRPGEISLSHHGILFLDELPEYKRNTLESLREPLESGRITISRANHQAEFPAEFQLVAAMNPCPCGFLNSRERECHCGFERVKKYHERLSGPLLDRIDLQIEVLPLPKDQPSTSTTSSAEIRRRIEVCREIQNRRQGKANARLSNKEISRFCTLEKEDQKMLETNTHLFKLSLRAQHKILKIARTIADLTSSAMIQTPHLREAFSYRCFDKIRKRN